MLNLSPNAAVSMTGEQSGIRYHRIRAPRGHAEAMVEPSPLEPGLLLEENARRYQVAAEASIGGVSLATLRRQAHADMIRLAMEHSAPYREVPAAIDEQMPLIVSGHQPALYHPGVWFKNFLIDQIANKTNGLAINVIVDNDVAPAPSIAALTGTPDEPVPTRIAYDEPGPRVPWEMTSVQSLDTLRSFAQRVAETFQPFVDDPAVLHVWPDVVREVEAGKPLGLAFSVARNRLEAAFGLNTLDVPLSQLCRTSWFCQFVASILIEAERYRSIYNDCVNQYRKVHGIRSTSHPVPDLEMEDDWIEVPFWIWTTDNAHRRQLWVTHEEDALRLSDRAGWEIRCPADDRLVPTLQGLIEHGAYLRPRALSNTTILRLAASDLFAHGIGGAKYDQVTDEIIRQFYGIEPPQYVTATATVLLPIERPAADADDVRAIDHKLRDAVFNPDRAVEACAEDHTEWYALVSQKQALLNDIPGFPEKAAWHRQLEEVNAKLRSQITEPVARLRIERDQITHQLNEKQLLASREFSFVLFPIERLRNLLLDLAEKES
ncbi:hypothetical protein [Bremerella cremea]|uniref:hypothetical protein n=1 Tax=Bremerella cremea TaxID=1031537 RepID=UPI0031E4F3D3